MNFPWWDGRSVALFDQILFLPHEIEGMSPVLQEVQQQISIEFCSGNGAWVVQKALDHPAVLWLAVEKKFDRAKKIWKRAKRLGVKNLLVVCGRAENLVEHVLQESSIQEVYINFPDPWPKRRHAKNRLIRSEFIALLQTKMTKGGSLMFVTDDYPYMTEGKDVLHQILTPLLPEPFYGVDPEGYGYSYFDELWRSQNKTIHYTIYANH